MRKRIILPASVIAAMFGAWAVGSAAPTIAPKPVAASKPEMVATSRPDAAGGATWQPVTAAFADYARSTAEESRLRGKLASTFGYVAPLTPQVDASGHRIVASLNIIFVIKDGETSTRITGNLDAIGPFIDKQVEVLGKPGPGTVAVPAKGMPAINGMVVGWIRIAGPAGRSTPKAPVATSRPAASKGT
jgi:hypothetical protein